MTAESGLALNCNLRLYFYISFIRSNKQSSKQTDKCSCHVKIYINKCFQSGGVWLRLPSGYLRQLFHYTNCTQSLIHIWFVFLWLDNDIIKTVACYVGSNSLSPPLSINNHTICTSFHPNIIINVI